MKLRIPAVLATLSLFALILSLSAQSVDVNATRKAAEQGNADAEYRLGKLNANYDESCQIVSKNCQEKVNLTCPV